METTTNISAFITCDFSLQNFDFSNIDRYELTSQLKAGHYEPFDYGHTSDNAFFEWANDNFSFEELYEVPIMNTVYYYPAFVSFKEEDRYKVASSTTLFYAIEEEAWAVGMTSGGMDLAPHLLDTFINLGKGVPLNIAQSISRGYSAYIDKCKHRNNCRILSDAFNQRASVLSGYADRLL